jgi:hypothetical protein
VHSRTHVLLSKSSVHPPVVAPPCASEARSAFSCLSESSMGTTNTTAEKTCSERGRCQVGQKMQVSPEPTHLCGDTAKNSWTWPNFWAKYVDVFLTCSAILFNIARSITTLLTLNPAQQDTIRTFVQEACEGLLHTCTLHNILWELQSAHQSPGRGSRSASPVRGWPPSRQPPPSGSPTV